MEEISSYPEKVAVLKQILKNGIQDLCEYAKKNSFLEFPYGRNPDPTPLITEEQFVAMGGLKCDDNEPLFKYEYGFDPLKYLSDYLLWAHPDAVRKRYEQKLAAQDRLTRRANHAIRQLETNEYFIKLMKKFQSGIEWGPFTVPLSMTSVRCMVKPFTPGIIYIQLSTEKDFETILRTFKIFHYPVEDAADATTNLITNSKVFDIQNLQEKKCYYLRTVAIPWDDATMKIDPKLSTAMIEMKESDDKFATELAGVKELFTLQCNFHHFWTIADPNFSLVSSHSPVLSDYSIHHQFPYERQSLYKLQIFGQLPVQTLHQRWERVFPTPAAPAPEIAELTEEEKDTLALEMGVPSSTGLLPSYSCFLGDFFEHRFYEKVALFQQQFPEASHEALSHYYYQLQLHQILSNFTEYSSALGVENKEGEEELPGMIKALQSAVLLAWRDSNPQSSQLLKWEETIYKQFRHDLKKYQKKYGLDGDKKARGGGDASKPGGGGRAHRPTIVSNSTGSAHVPPAPVLKRPPLSPQLETLLQGFPMIHAHDLPTVPPSQPTTAAGKQKAVKPDPSIIPLRTAVVDQDAPQSCRMLYRSVMISGDVQLIILDVRRMQGKVSLGCDYLGKEQAEWLQFILQSSQATWKIICVGKAFGVCGTETVTIQKESDPERPSAFPMDPNAILSIPTADENMAVLPSGSYESLKSEGTMKSEGVVVHPEDDNASINLNDPQPKTESQPEPTKATETITTNNAPTRKDSLKPVQFLLPEHSPPGGNHIYLPEDPAHHYENHSNLYGECDETYGRSKYSLQYILAEYENKYRASRGEGSEANSVAKDHNNNNNVSAPGTARGGTAGPPVVPLPVPRPMPIQDLNGHNTFHHIASQTGIIVLSSGVGTHWTTEEEILITNTNKPKTPTTPSSRKEGMTPPAPSEPNSNVTSTVSLVTKNTTLTNINEMMLPSYCAAYYTLNSPIIQPFYLVNGYNHQPLSPHRGNPAMYVEIGLGSLTPTAQYRMQEMVNKGGHYQYLAGMDAFTYYCQLSEESRATVEESSYSYCQIYALPDSALKVSVYSSSLPPSFSISTGETSERSSKDRLIYECICTVVPSEDDQSQGSVFMA